MLFALFAEKSNWSFKDLRARTEQPAEYLKEVLTLIAFLHRSGELNGQYTLLENYQDQDSQDSVIILCPQAFFVCLIFLQLKVERMNDPEPTDIPYEDNEDEDEDDMEEIE